MATFGRTSTTATNGNSVADNKYSGQFTLAEAGFAVSMSFYLAGSAGTVSFRGGLYGPDSTLDAATPLVGSTEEGSVPASEPVAWYTVNFTNPVDLAAGDYNLTLHTDGEIVVHRDAAGGTHALATDAYAGGLESTYGAIDATGTNHYCFYVTYHVMRGSHPRAMRVTSPTMKAIQRSAG